MFKKVFFLLLLLFFISFNSFCQLDFSNYDFSKADNVALNTSISNNDYFKLAKDLTSPFDKEADKIRAIFRWITDNIAYDYKAFNKGKTDPFFVCQNNNNCGGQENTYNTELIHRILNKKKAVCNGYSLLFKTLCTAVGIKSDIVTGYVKTKPYQIGVKAPADHAWNIVMIDSTWYCLDVIWAAGSAVVNSETDEIVDWKKHFTPFFFCTAYEKFVRNHFPEHPEELKFIDSRNTKEDFFNFPFYYTLESLDDIENITPLTGMLKAKVGDTLTFSFKYDKPFQHFQVNSNMQSSPTIFEEVGKGKHIYYKIDSFMLTKQVYYPYEKKGDMMVVKYPVTSSSLYYIELLFDYEKAVRYKVTIPYVENK